MRAIRTSEAAQGLVTVVPLPVPLPVPVLLLVAALPELP